MPMPKAPADWRPSPDQQRRIQEDSRLRGMSRDDLYFFFNKPKAEPKKDEFKEAFQERARKPKRGLLGTVADRVTSAMRR